MKIPNRFLARLAIAVVLLIGAFLPGQAIAAETQVFFVRHAEFNADDPDKMLTEAGQERALALARRFENQNVAYVFSSHTIRTRDTVSPLAAGHGLSVRQFPQLGSTVDGKLVTNRVSGKIAIGPLLNALRRVPEGSTVVVAGNSGNLFAIMAGLGVGVAKTDGECREEDASCLPCADKSCFPASEFNNLWRVMVTTAPCGVTRMSATKYGN